MYDLENSCHLAACGLMNREVASRQVVRAPIPVGSDRVAFSLSPFSRSFPPPSSNLLQSLPICWQQHLISIGQSITKVLTNGSFP